jgi:hypothetical protein
MPAKFIIGICFVLLALRIIYLLIDMIRQSLTPRYTFLRHLPQSLIVKTPVRKVDGLCDTAKQVEG